MPTNNDDPAGGSENTYLVDLMVELECAEEKIMRDRSSILVQTCFILSLGKNLIDVIERQL